jgi:hypothetical protein
MRRARQSGKTACCEQTARPVWAVLACAVGLAVLVGGCQSINDTKAQPGDPLMGEKVPDKPFGVIGPTPPPQNRAGMTPAQPPSIASKSLVGALIPDTIPGGKSLAINDPLKQSTPVPAPDTWQPKNTGNLTAGQGVAPVILRVPEATIPPVPPPVLGTNLTVQPSAYTLPAGSTDYDQLQAALKKRGVVWQNQKTLPDGLHFICGVANSQDANFTRIYEAIAQDYRSAVLAVLEQIDQKR